MHFLEPRLGMFGHPSRASSLPGGCTAAVRTRGAPARTTTAAAARWTAARAARPMFVLRDRVVLNPCVREAADVFISLG